MNNQQFRRLLADQPRSDHNETNSANKHDQKPSGLGDRRSGVLGMAPRNVKGAKGSDFARTTRGKDGQPATKKFKSSAPRGSTIAEGFTDRARARAEAADEEEKDDKAARIKALEEQLKLEQISRKTFERLREEIAGGNISSTHLIKGLDRKLLERVRRGEDVLTSSAEPEPTVEVDVDVDDELDKLEDAVVETVQKEKVEKKGVTAPMAAADRKRTRDEIMAELKAKRRAAAEAQVAQQQPVLDPSRWMRVGDKQKSKIVIDHKGREVLITVDEDGIVKRKIRKAPAVVAEPTVKLDPTKSVLGADVVVPEQPTEKIAAPDDYSDDDDIFEGAGTDYDPLGPDEDSEDGEAEAKQKVAPQPAKADGPLTQRRNYFNDESATTDQPSTDHFASIKAAIEKAGKLNTPIEARAEDNADAARRARHAEMLANKDRDLDDMDMGFGASRFEDGEDGGDGEKIRLSEWKGGKHDHGEDSDDKRNHDKKKRKPKKRKGDANNFADIMTVIERRKDTKK